MIEKFKDRETRNTGIIYKSMLDQVKQIYALDPEKAGEFAISLMEMVLTGDSSTNSMEVQVMLIPYKDVNQKNIEKYEKKVEETKAKKIDELRLGDIAQLSKQGMKQKDIAAIVGIPQQTVSYRLGMIRKDYAFLLEDYQ